jgi:hypothetical protein
MSGPEKQTAPDDIDRLARAMLVLHGPQDAGPSGPSTGGIGTWSKAPSFAADPDRAAAVRAATAQDRDRYLHSGLQPVACRFCHVEVGVKKLGPGHTAVQWNSQATRRCAYFAEIRDSGGDSARARSCPKLADSIRHAVAEGCLEAVSSAPPPGDG